MLRHGTQVDGVQGDGERNAVSAQQIRNLAKLHRIGRRTDIFQPNQHPVPGPHWAEHPRHHVGDRQGTVQAATVPVIQCHLSDVG